RRLHHHARGTERIRLDQLEAVHGGQGRAGAALRALSHRRVDEPSLVLQGVTSTNPMPRRAVIFTSAEAFSSFLRSRVTCTSTTFDPGSKCMSHTRSSSSVRVTTCPRLRRKCSSSWNSFAVSGHSVPLTNTSRDSRLSTTFPPA